VSRVAVVAIPTCRDDHTSEAVTPFALGTHRFAVVRSNPKKTHTNHDKWTPERRSTRIGRRLYRSTVGEYYAPLVTIVTS